MKKLLKYFTFIFICLLFNITSVYAEEDINIRSVRVVGQSGTITLGRLDYSGGNIYSNVEFNKINDFVTYEIELENTSYKKYLLESVSVTDNEYLTSSSENVNSYIDPKSTSTIQVKVKYENELLNQEEDILNNFSLSLNYSYGDISNPNTGFNKDYIILFIIILSLIGVGFVLFKIKKKQVIVLFLLLPMFVLAKEYKPVTINFSNVKVKGRFVNYRIEIDDGSGEHTLKGKRYGDTVDNLSEPSKDGYNFTGWEDQDGNVVTNETVVSKDMLVTAQYEPINYNITYDLNGGILRAENPSTINIESDFTLNNPTKEGYNFVGWSINDGQRVYPTIRKYSRVVVKQDIHYKAVYSEAALANYTVIHRKYISRDLYEELERETLSGPIGSTVNVMSKNYEGLSADRLPLDSSVTITEDGLATVTITYNIMEYKFLIENFDGYDNDNSTSTGIYSYGTEIVLNAEDRPGYTLWWSDGETGNHRTFELKKNVSLSAQYIPNGEVQYKVIHKKQNIPGTKEYDMDGPYFTADESYFSGIPGEEIEPATNIYEGFTAPQAERIRLVEGESNAVVYYYTKNKYRLIIEEEENVESNKPSGEYYYGTWINLKAKHIDGYSFEKWSDDSTRNPYDFSLNGDITIKAIYGEPYALFDNGSTINQKMKRLAGNESPNYNTQDTNIQQIVKASALPDNFTPTSDNIVSSTDSDYPIYIWYEDNTIYYYTEPEKIYLNNDSSIMFKEMRKLSSIDEIDEWDVSRVTKINSMFSRAGHDASTFNIDVSDWDVSNVINMSFMFDFTGYNSTTWSIGDLSHWNVSNVKNMNAMFQRAGSNVTSFNIGNLSGWDTSKVTNMSYMFSSAGYSAATWNIGDLSDWNVSNVTDMGNMFSSTGYNATTWNIGDLSNWDTSKVTDMSSMFSSAGYNVATWNSIGNLKVYASNILNMFSYCPKAKVTLNIYNNPTKYSNAFYSAATESGSRLTVNYTSDVTNIDNIIATKSSNSNVYKGSLIPNN